jgi:hypothetical protein
VLTNGTYGTITEPGGAPDRSHASFALAGGGSATGTFATYTLNLAASPSGYDISRIDVYGGWNDSGRDQQLYTVAYSLIGSSTFIDLPSVNFNPTIGANLQSALASRSLTRARRSWRLGSTKSASLSIRQWKMDTQATLSST